jgi:hypothetical protein
MDLAGVRVGDTVTVTYTITGAHDKAMGDGNSGAIPTEGTINAAVAEKVPFDEFPVPPHPDNLANQTLTRRFDAGTSRPRRTGG